MPEDKIRQLISEMMDELLEVAGLEEGDLFVVGCSTSEIMGEHIGSASSEELGVWIFDVIHKKLSERGIYLAAQGCEHINRALVIEKKAAKERGYTIVNVVPWLHAGGAFSLATYRGLSEPVLVEGVQAQAGLDIGDTFIGMHIEPILVPVRLKHKKIGKAHVMAARRRPKYIGGPRAEYDYDLL